MVAVLPEDAADRARVLLQALDLDPEPVGARHLRVGPTHCYHPRANAHSDHQRVHVPLVLLWQHWVVPGGVDHRSRSPGRELLHGQGWVTVVDPKAKSVRGVKVPRLRAEAEVLERAQPAPAQLHARDEEPIVAGIVVLQRLDECGHVELLGGRPGRHVQEPVDPRPQDIEGLAQEVDQVRIPVGGGLDRVRACCGSCCYCRGGARQGCCCSRRAYGRPEQHLSRASGGHKSVALLQQREPVAARSRARARERAALHDDALRAPGEGRGHVVGVRADIWDHPVRRWLLVGQLAEVIALVLHCGQVQGAPEVAMVDGAVTGVFAW
mmetsp:Transcript_96642/g.273300  ORF Transcript_96642/g.273300 Transcript_96642/m.273300 type:complete len:324 (+) Transcript_96642:295-1266(+)